MDGIAAWMRPASSRSAGKLSVPPSQTFRTRAGLGTSASTGGGCAGRDADPFGMKTTLAGSGSPVPDGRRPARCDQPPAIIVDRNPRETAGLCPQ